MCSSDLLELYNLVLILGFRSSTVWPIKWDIVKAFLGSVECFILVSKYSVLTRRYRQSFFWGWDIIKAFPGNVGRA